MDRSEFRIWADDLLKRLPDLGAHVDALPKDTRDVWFTDIFEPCDLRDGYQLNKRLMESGEGLAKYERDKLPALFIRILQEVAHKRRQADDKTRQRHVEANKLLRGDPIMGRVLRQLEARQRVYRQEHDVKETPDRLRREWLDELWAEAEAAQ